LRLRTVTTSCNRCQSGSPIGRNPIGLVEALMLGDDRRLDELLTAGASALQAVPNRGSLLMFARTVHAIDRLIEAGVPPNIEDKWEITPVRAVSRLGVKSRPSRRTTLGWETQQPSRGSPNPIPIRCAPTASCWRPRRRAISKSCVGFCASARMLTRGLPIQRITQRCTKLLGWQSSNGAVARHRGRRRYGARRQAQQYGARLG
jgi:hypothetical protein